ncbi:hypothetical protein HanIR_Chr12g0611921 [Helianthus annuus]|nr:hypothetical protein HanIR_Chr12g0611921 [Helianthus annuus]
MVRPFTPDRIQNSDTNRSKPQTDSSFTSLFTTRRSTLHFAGEPPELVHSPELRTTAIAAGPVAGNRSPGNPLVHILLGKSIILNSIPRNTQRTLR